MIEVAGVSFSYPGLESPVLHDINLEIRPGEFLALLGRNGSGKSTFTRLLNGLLVPAAGDVIVDGYNTRDSSHRLRIRQQVGLLFSTRQPLVAGIVEEDVALVQKTLGLPAAEIRERVRWALSVVGSRRSTSVSAPCCRAGRSRGSPLPAYSPSGRATWYWTNPPRCSILEAEEVNAYPDKLNLNREPPSLWSPILLKKLAAAGG